MTDSADFRRVQDTDALAKKLGYKLSHRIGSIVICSTKGIPAAIYGKNSEVISFETVEEVRGFLRGWVHILHQLSYINFDEAEYKKRVNDRKVLDALKGKK